MTRLIFALTTLALLILTCSAQSQRPILIPAPGSPLAAEAKLGALALADVNKDGNLDIIAASGVKKDVTVLLGDAKGGFGSAPGSPFKVSMGMHLVVVGDLTKDGNPDLALTNHDSHDVTVLSGNGEGGFATAPGSPFSSVRKSKAHNHGLALGDANGDGNLDIVTDDQDDNSVTVLLSNGRGGFAPAPGSPFSVGRGPYPLALGDLNGDGKLDVVTPNTGSHNVSVLLGDGKGAFAPASGSPFSVGTHTSPLSGT